MRILDEAADKSINRVTLFLTYSEAHGLIGSLNDLIKQPMNNHSHISSEDYQKEVTVCIYNTDDLRGFNERSIEIISNDA